MRAFTAAAVQVAAAPGPLTAASVTANVAKGAAWVTRCVQATGAELVVLPESASTGFTPGTGPDELWDLVSEVPGPVTEPVQEAARSARGARGVGHVQPRSATRHGLQQRRADRPGRVRAGQLPPRPTPSPGSPAPEAAG